MSDAASTTAPQAALPFDLDHTRSAWDALTPQVMRERGSLKWAQSPFGGAHAGARDTGEPDAGEPGTGRAPQPAPEPIGAWVAEMDLGTAPSVTAVLREAVETGNLGYMPGGLARAAREAAVRYYAEEVGWQVPLEQVCLLPNVLSALAAVIAFHTRPGSSVVVPTPAYMPFLSIPGQQGRACVQVPSLYGAGRWRLDLDALEDALAGRGAFSEHGPAGLLVLCNPWNPVGRVLEPAELDAVAALSARYGVPVFSDEIHAPVVLNPDTPLVPYASRPGADPDLTYTATAASKGWNVPGLHCAMLIAAGQARREWDAHPLSSALAHQAAALGAAAARAAFDDGREWNRAVREYVRGNALVVASELAQVEGVRMTVPDGTYLAWLDLSVLGRPEGLSPAAWLARRAGVWMNDGGAFGRGYEGFARLNLATGRGIAEEIGRRLVRAASALG